MVRSMTKNRGSVDQDSVTVRTARARSPGHQRSITVNPVIRRRVPAGQHFAGQGQGSIPDLPSWGSAVTCRSLGGASRRWRFSFDFAGWCGRLRPRQAVEDGRHPSADDRGGPSRAFAVLRDMFGQAPSVRIGDSRDQQGDPARGRATRGSVSDQRRGCCRCNWAWLRLVHLEAV